MFLFIPSEVHNCSLLFLYCVQGVLAAKCPDVSQSMESVASQLQQVQEEEEQTEVGITKEWVHIPTPFPIIKRECT